MDGFDSARLDELLRMFEGTGNRIPQKVLLGNEPPEDWCIAISFLVDKGYLKEHDDCFEITYKGKAFIHDGGFVGKNRRERVLLYCAVVAVVCSILAFIVSLVALVCQLRG